MIAHARLKNLLDLYLFGLEGALRAVVLLPLRELLALNASLDHNQSSNCPLFV